MVYDSSTSSHNNSEKRDNSFKKMLDKVKNFMKKEEEDNKPSSFEAAKIKKNPDSNISKSKTSKKEIKRSMRERKENSKEQKLPTKFKKGW
jgi:hypothetical protein